MGRNKKNCKTKIGVFLKVLKIMRHFVKVPMSQKTIICFCLRDSTFLYVPWYFKKHAHRDVNTSTKTLFGRVLCMIQTKNHKQVNIVTEKKNFFLSNVFINMF